MAYEDEGSKDDQISALATESIIDIYYKRKQPTEVKFQICEGDTKINTLIAGMKWLCKIKK